MDAIQNLIRFILDLGATVMMPIIIMLLGLGLRQKFSQAIRSGLTVGMGFAGIFLVIGLFSSNLSPAAKAMVENFGLHLDVLDVGWPVHAAISFGTPIVPIVFIMGVLINIIMLTMNWTKTMDIDLWNYWHFIFAGGLVMYKTGSTVLGIIASCITIIIVLKLADYTQPYVEKYFGMPGISLPHTEDVGWAPICILLNKIIDKIPVINKIELNPQSIQKHFGVMGEPMFIGLVLGGFIGFLAGYDSKGIIQLGINMAAVMFLLPRMSKILMEGLMPLSDSAREFLNSRFPGKKVFIGLDSAVVVGNPSVMAVCLLMIPITLLLAAILPGNRIMPFTDLAGLCFCLLWAVGASRGNVFRGLIISTILMIFILYIATDIAPVSTIMAKEVGFPFPEGTLAVSSLDGGSHFIPYIIYKIIAFFQ
ncbi:PTS galactitol transporter subunit IIC [Pectinatus cerevisiiphilus]|uniref:PTS system galactitol-specific IIC component n=1 Tax=Pectinatus cerevisiiphilus TaxID=86956 RepID=A0A4R3KAC3_9FIRM|nr:PTS transporter subunit IIC [Pectinatus cerevisiiphilus]TCS79947.1 PTS system galactitol-specific IIC component [Pectinatus cerevisiiphilus]